jgi:nucleoside-diphosphate-sugar epimerase
MSKMAEDAPVAGPDDQILVTGSSGFIGKQVVAALRRRGFKRIRCFVRPSSDLNWVEGLKDSSAKTGVEVFRGNLLSREDCSKATEGVRVIYHLAVGAGGRSFPDAYLNAVVTTRNLIEGSIGHGCLKRLVNMSSFAVYSNRKKPKAGLLDESCPVEEVPHLRDAYCYAKVKQDELVMDYGRKSGLGYVILRPGVVYGPGKAAITGRVGIGTFGLFLHLGGSNPVPLTYVDNCADAVVLAGIKPGINGEVFNIVDDELPSSREFLRAYKKNVKKFRSLYLPRPVSYLLCYLWESYSNWSEGQLPPALNRKVWHAHWKGSRYTNGKLKRQLGWKPDISTHDGLDRFFAACREENANA